MQNIYNTLDLTGKQLDMLPVFNYTAIEELLLDRNLFETLPDDIGQMQNLKTLNAFSNKLSSIPESIGQLNKLQIFNVGNNHITALPESFEELSNLYMFDIGHNNLNELPDSIGGLKTSFSIFKYE